MPITETLKRAARLAVAALALFAAVAPLAADPAGQPAAVAALSAAPAAAAGGAPAAEPFADQAALGFTAAPAAPGSVLQGPACRAEATAARCIPGVNCHGYCACECSRTKDCNTNSDCSNHRCLSGISCC